MYSSAKHVRIFVSACACVNFVRGCILWNFAQIIMHLFLCRQCIPNRLSGKRGAISWKFVLAWWLHNPVCVCMCVCGEGGVIFKFALFWISRHDVRNYTFLIAAEIIIHFCSISDIAEWWIVWGRRGVCVGGCICFANFIQTIIQYGYSHVIAVKLKACLSLVCVWV